MICRVCRKTIKKKETRSYFHKGKVKHYGCQDCSNNGSFDRYIDKCCSDITDNTADPSSAPTEA